MACRAIPPRPRSSGCCATRVRLFHNCTKDGRDYLIRLPNVAYSAIADNQELAEMMNFVVFGLGGGASAPKARKAAARPPKLNGCGQKRWAPNP